MLPWLLALLAQTAPPDLPLITVGPGGADVARSARLAFADVLPDAGGSGVVRVTQAGITLDFEGRELRGAPPGAEPDAYAGTGVWIAADGVTLRHARISGFRCGVRVQGACGVVLEDCDVGDNFRQRLRSTPEAEDEGDWLTPHENDAGEWLARYGAGISAEDCAELTVRRCRARDGQNGLLLSRVVDSAVYDCDFSFLSGWGVALWRSSRNMVARNALDFCVRGYSHGVYNRGQDSAGILLFEQSSQNVITDNSVTHGGDGLFGFAGREALGEHPAPEEGFEYRGRGCNHNAIARNDFSYAAAHGLELTFSFNNQIYDNRFVGNAICGIWGGYSHDTRIYGNTFEENGDAGYGIERGAINAEHAVSNLIRLNTFRRNACGVHLWWDEDEGLLSLPWAQANGTACEGSYVQGNRFEGDALAIYLRGCDRTLVERNTYEVVGEELRVEDQGWHQGRRIFARLRLFGDLGPGATLPVGARAHLAGREHILMTEWGPYDYEGPYLRPLPSAESGARAFELLGRADRSGGVDLEGCEVHVEGKHITVRSQRAGGVARYTVFAEADAKNGGAPERAERSGVIVDARWQVTAFASPCDPRADIDAWRSAAAGGVAFELDRLVLPFGNGGPSDLPGLPAPVAAARLPADAFGTLARAHLKLPAGRWRIKTVSDDGLRVLVDGELLIDAWSHHAPERHDAELALDAEREVELAVEHFELDGSATLSVELEAVE